MIALRKQTTQATESDHREYHMDAAIAGSHNSGSQKDFAPTTSHQSSPQKIFLKKFQQKYMGQLIKLSEK